MNKFPKLSITPREVADRGILRYGDGFITAEYPPMAPRKTAAKVCLAVDFDNNKIWGVDGGTWSDLADDPVTNICGKADVARADRRR